MRGKSVNSQRMEVCTDPVYEALNWLESYPKGNHETSWASGYEDTHFAAELRNPEQ